MTVVQPFGPARPLAMAQAPARAAGDGVGLSSDELVGSIYAGSPSFLTACGTGVNIWLHEKGHAMAAEALFRNAAPRISLARPIGGVTLWNPTGGLTVLGNRFGSDGARALVSAAGPLVDAGIATTAFAAGYMLRHRHPWVGRTLMGYAGFSMLNDTFYALSSLTEKAATLASVGNDFAALAAFGGIPRVVSLVATAALLPLEYLALRGLERRGWLPVPGAAAGPTAAPLAVASLAPASPAPAPPDPLAAASEAFVAWGDGSERAPRQAALDRMLRARPGLDPGVVDGGTVLAGSGNDPELRLLALDVLASAVEANPDVTAAQIRALGALAREPLGSSLARNRFEVARTVARLRPDLPLPLLDGMARYLDVGGSGEGRRTRLSDAVRLLGEHPGMDADDLGRAFDAARGTFDARDAGARLEAALCEQEARAALAPGVPGPRLEGSPPRSELALARRVESEPCVRAAERGWQLGRDRLQRYDAALAGDGGVLLALDHDLYESALTEREQHRHLWMACSALGTLGVGAAVTVALPAALAPMRLLVGGVTAVAGLLLAPLATYRLMGRSLPSAVERDVRAALQAPRDYWAGRVESLRETRDQARSETLRRLRDLAEAAPIPQPSTVRSSGEDVVIGSIRVARRSDPDPMRRAS